MSEGVKMIEVESSGNPTRDMYLEYFPDFLKSIFEVLPQIDEESRNTIWDAIGATCFHVNRKIREKGGEICPTGLTMEEAANFLVEKEHSRDHLKREFTKIINGEEVLVREREYRATWDGEKFETESGIGRLYGNICTCLLKSCGLIEPDGVLCQQCQQGMGAEAVRFLTDGKYPEHIHFESPENYCNGCDHCHAILYYPIEKREHIDF